MFFPFRKKHKAKNDNVIVYKSGLREVKNERVHAIANEALNAVDKKLRVLGIR